MRQDRLRHAAGWTVFSRWTLGAAMLLGAVGGCQKKPETPVNEESKTPYGLLPGLRGTPDAKLREELSRIEADRATPELLTRPITILESENVAAGLVDLFRTSELGTIRQTLDELFPPGKFEFNLMELNGVKRLTKKHLDARKKARTALVRPKCDFGVRHTDGFMADTTFVDVARICGRLEAFFAAECLFQDRNVEAAVESLRFQLRMAKCLAAEPRVESRLEAADMRDETLRVLQAVVDSGLAERSHLELIRDTIEKDLKEWPSDAAAWIGDRAAGMIDYEAVRDGQLATRLTPDEIKSLSDEGVLEDLVKTAPKTVDADEAYYLRTMREVIRRCDKESYHARADLADQIQEELKKLRSTPDYPVVADRFLLPDLGIALRRQAEDRARMEAWALALDQATGKPSAHQVNPMTGKPFRVERKGDRVYVWLAASPSSKRPADVTVPIPAKP